MLKKILVILFSLLFVISCETGQTDNGNTEDILEKLQSLQGITVTEIAPSGGYTRAFQIDIIQPVDHNNPSGQTFTQRLYLHHAGESYPMIFYTNGYTAGATYIHELAGFFTANHLCAEHRYFPDARPVPTDWQYLTVGQAASDHHHIIELFKTIYQDRWITTGISKSGVTALIHRRFFPDDADATVAYVAPFSLGVEDPRYDDFLLNQVSTAACRKKITDFQRRLLEKREDLLPFVEDLMEDSGARFSLSAGEVYEYGVMEYIFVFWQFGPGDCSQIPAENVTDRELFDHFNGVVGLDMFSDGAIDQYGPHYYQAYTQMGYYRLITDHLEDLLAYATDPSYSIYAPRNVPLNFDASVMPPIISWLQNSGNNIIYIYGALDPWTAGAVIPTASTNALWFNKAGKDHRVRIGDLSDSERNRVFTALENWTGISINRSSTVHLKDPVHQPHYMKKKPEPVKNKE